MKEWSNPWNPFNSAKVLLWREHLEACAREDYLPPVTVDVDPSNRCPLNCYFCNAKHMIHSSMRDMPEDHMIKLVEFLAFWRDSTRHKTPNSACVAGGGESFMNSNLVTLYEEMYRHGMEIGIITSGYIMRKEHLDIIPRAARWIGFSVDAANSETYSKIKGIKEAGFKRVIENMKAVIKANNDYTGHRTSISCDVSFKFLLTPDNAFEVYEAIKLAKEIGVKDFHLRPAGWDNLPEIETKPVYTPEMIEQVNKQIAEGMKLETKDFRVFGIRHKFNPDFSRSVPFSRCLAIPLLPTFGADGNVHTCFDMRGRSMIPVPFPLH